MKIRDFRGKRNLKEVSMHNYQLKIRYGLDRSDMRKLKKSYIKDYYRNQYKFRNGLSLEKFDAYHRRRCSNLCKFIFFRLKQRQREKRK